MNKIIFTDKEYAKLLNGETVWNCVYYQMKNGVVWDITNDCLVEFEIVETSLEKTTFSKEQVLKILIELTNVPLKIETVYIDRGAEWMAPNIIGDGIQWIYPGNIESFNNNNFTLEKIIVLAQRIKDHYARRQKSRLA